MAFESKTVMAPILLQIRNAKEAEQAVASYGEYINLHAVDGWEFYSLESVSLSENPGCLGVLFGKKEQVTTYYMMVFRREK